MVRFNALSHSRRSKRWGVGFLSITLCAGVFLGTSEKSSAGASSLGSHQPKLVGLSNLKSEVKIPSGFSPKKLNLPHTTAQVQTNVVHHETVAPVVLTLVVNTTDDTNAPSIATCRDEVATACSLRSAVQTADYLEVKTKVGPIQIDVGPGTYTLSETTLLAHTLTSSQTNYKELFFIGLSGIIIKGSGKGTTIIRQTPTSGARVAYVSTNGFVHFTTLTLSGGQGPSLQTYLGHFQGGDLINFGAAVLSNVEVSTGTALVGGGIYNGGTLWMSDSVVTTNSASTRSEYRQTTLGGGISNFGVMTFSNDVIENNVSINLNSTTFVTCSARPSGQTHPHAGCEPDSLAYGGGIANGGILTINGGSVVNDTAISANNTTATSLTWVALGGGLMTEGVATLTGVLFNNDHVTGDGGTQPAYGGAAVGGTSYVGCTFSNNSAYGAKAGGGALVFIDSSTVLQSDSFIDNLVTGAYTTSGGAISEVGALPGVISQTLIDDDFSGNSVTALTATGSQSLGGALSVASENDDLSIVDSTFTTNSMTLETASAMGLGGALFYEVLMGGTLSITTSTFQNNSIVSDGTSYGGALCIVGARSPLLLHADTIRGNHLKTQTTSNTAPKHFGGGLSFEGFLTMSDSVIETNSATFGGGLELSAGVETLNSTSVINNKATTGAGLMTIGSSFVAVNDTIMNNRTDGTGGEGGGLLLELGDADLHSDTVATNLAGFGAGIADFGESGYLQDVAIVGNISSRNGQFTSCDEGQQLFMSAGFNDVQNATLSEDGSTCFTPALGDISAPAHLSAVSYYGGSTPTAVPEFGSPLIGNGGTACAPLDQRGFSRENNSCTIGAVEVPDTSSYYEVASDGGVFAFGTAHTQFFGSMGGQHLNAPVVSIATTPDGRGYWLVASDGGVFSFGDAQFFGSMGGQHLNAPIVAMAATPDGLGYWLVASDGGVFDFGDAGFFGSAVGENLRGRIVGIAPSRDGLGYLIATSGGSVYSFGDAAFKGEIGSEGPPSPIVGIAADPQRDGYWLAASNGAVYAFGLSSYDGSMGNATLNKAIVGIKAMPDGRGYDLVGADGGLFDFGDARYEGSMGNLSLNAPVVGVS